MVPAWQMLCFIPTSSTDVSESHQVHQGQEQQLFSLLGQEKTPLFGHHRGEGEKLSVCASHKACAGPVILLCPHQPLHPSCTVIFGT